MNDIINAREKAMAFCEHIGDTEPDTTACIMEEFLAFCGVSLFKAVFTRDQRSPSGDGTITQETKFFLDKLGMKSFAEDYMAASHRWPVGPWTSCTFYGLDGKELV